MTDKFLYERKIKTNTDINVWLGYPGSKSFAYSSLGYMFIYKKLDLMENVFMEPIYAETTKTLIMPKDVDVFGFSMSFDFDFVNVLNILNKYKIPLKRTERIKENPLIFGGGPVLTSNPEPYHEIFDFIIIGDGENVLDKVIDICKLKKSRDEILILLSELEGIYVPSMPREVKKLTCKKLKIISTPILSKESFFSDTYVIEIERGCSNRCGFCLASYINLPIRFNEYDNIISSINFGLNHTNKIALLGAMIGGHPRFEDICDYIYNRINNNENIELMFSSLRADNIKPIVVKTLVASGQKTSTIAIESADENLRKRVNKNITNEQIIDCIKICQENGLKGLKIYSMIGLPTETQANIEEFINFAKTLRKEFKNFNLTFAFSTFVPKAHTPFQWCQREEINSLKKKQNYLKKEFHKIGMKADFSSAKWDYFQSILSIGGRDISEKLFEILKNGANSSAYLKAFKDINIKYEIDQELPWDFIKINPQKEFLKSEYKRLLK